MTRAKHTTPIVARSRPVSSAMKPKPEDSKNRPINLTNNSFTDYLPDWQPLVN